jgi:hypothetical protein
MKVVIIEDERIGARKLENMLLSIDPTIEFVAVLESVLDAKAVVQLHTLLLM